MTDHPIPDDLLDWLGRSKIDTGLGDFHYLGEPAARALLQALAEWADGALIDHRGWRRLDADATQFAIAVRGGDKNVPVYTLTPREQADG